MTDAEPEIVPCKGRCGRMIVKWRPNRKLCEDCARDSLRESKRLWQAQWRARTKKPYYERSEEAQRRDASFDSGFDGEEA